MNVLVLIAVLSWLRMSSNWFWNKVKNSPNLGMFSLCDYCCFRSRAAVGFFSSAFQISSWLDFLMHSKWVSFYLPLCIPDCWFASFPGNSTCWATVSVSLAKGQAASLHLTAVEIIPPLIYLSIADPLGSMCTKIRDLLLSGSAVWVHGLCIFNPGKWIKIFSLAHLQTDEKVCKLMLQQYEDYKITMKTFKDTICKNFTIW